MPTPQTAGRNSSFTMNRRIGAAKAKEIVVVADFIEGYRNREDASLLKPQHLVGGSHDVLVNRSGRVQSRQGYIMDGAKSSVVAPVRAPFDWKTQTGFSHHLRACLLTSAGNDGQLQIRYIDTLGALGSAGNISWLPLLTGLTSTYFQYTNYWDTTAIKAKLLMVNRTSKFWEWTGAIGTFLSATATTVTLNGTMTLAQLGFDTSGSIIVGGVTYTYSSIANQTFSGVSADLSASTLNIPVYQAPVQSAAFSGMTFTGTPTPASYFTLDLITVLRNSNQVLVASILSNQVYMSKAGTYIDYSQSTARLQYEGDMFTTIGSVTSFQPQEDSVYISAGNSEWYMTNFVQTTISNSTTGTTQVFENSKLAQLKTAALQGAQSQYASTKIANNVAFLSFDPGVLTIGRVANNLATPAVSDEGFPIQNDIDAYKTTDAWMAYNKKLLYVGFPAMGLLRIFNMTNPKNPFWEAPQNIPLSGLSFEGTTVIGHSYNTSESYIMNTGYSDRAADANSTGLPISCVAQFAFQEAGLRAKRKSFNKFFVEGYIGSATALTVGLIFRSPNPGLLPSQNLTINGTGSYVLISQSQVTLGISTLGINPLGSDIQLPQQLILPPYFAVVLTSQRAPHLAYQPTFTSNGVNQVWELLAYGNNSAPTSENEIDITN